MLPCSTRIPTSFLPSHLLGPREPCFSHPIKSSRFLEDERKQGATDRYQDLGATEWGFQEPKMPFPRLTAEEQKSLECALLWPITFHYREKKMCNP